jgi:hypothetical protein
MKSFSIEHHKINMCPNFCMLYYRLLSEFFEEKNAYLSNEYLDEYLKLNKIGYPYPKSIPTR